MSETTIAQLQEQLERERAARLEAERRLAEMEQQLEQALADERKRSGKTISHEGFLLRALMDTVPDHIYFKDRDSRFIRICKTHAKLFGLTDPADAIGKTDSDFFSAEHAQHAREDERRIIETGQPLTVEELETWPNQPNTWVSTIKAALRDEDGTIVGTFGISRDITERRRIESMTNSLARSLEESQARLQQSLNEFNDLVARIPVGIYKLRQFRNGGERFEFVSSRLCGQLGVTAEAVYADPNIPFNHIHHKDLPEFLRRTEIARRRMEPVVWEGRMFGPAGIGWMHIKSSPSLLPDGDTLWNGMLYDVTERRRAEELKEELLRFQQKLMDAVPSPIFYKDAEGRYIGGNKAFSQYIGLSPEQYIGKSVYDISPGDLAAIYDKADKALMQQPGVQTYEASVVYADGERHQVIFNKSTFSDSEGRVAGLIGVILDITERKNAEDILRQSEENFRNFFENNASVMMLMDPASGRIISANKAACSYYGYTREQLEGLPMSDINCMSPERIAEESLRALREECNFFRFTHRLASGEMREVEVHLTPIESRGRPLMFSIVHDVTERTRAEATLRLAATAFSHAREGIMITRPDSSIIEVNAAFTDITGYSREEVIGCNPRLLQSGRQDKEFYAAMWNDLLSKGQWSGELWNRRKNGEEYAALLTISAVLDARKGTQHYVALFSDITPIKDHERELKRIAHYDALTTLPNRVLLADRLQQAMAQTVRRGTCLAVVYLDLDGFKAVNDSYGHEVGDQMLMAVSQRMKQALREGDTLARLGGDEFVAVLLDLADATRSDPTLRRLLAAAAEPVTIDGRVLAVSASLGVTFYPQPGEVEADHLLRQADQAMYQAKLEGKNRYLFFRTES